MSNLTRKQYIDIIHKHCEGAMSKCAIGHFVLVYSSEYLQTPDKITLHKTRSFEYNNGFFEIDLKPLLKKGFAEIKNSYMDKNGELEWGWIKLTPKAVQFFTVIEFFEEI